MSSFVTLTTAACGAPDRMIIAEISPVAQLLEREVVVVVHALDVVDLQHVEDDLRGDLGLAVLEIEAHLLAAQVVEALDVAARQDVELGIVQLGDVLDALLDVGVELGIALFQEHEVVLVDHAHVDALEEQHVVEILQAADARAPEARGYRPA